MGKQEETSVKRFENISETVLDRIEKFKEDGSITLPMSYSVANHLKSAWLVLQSTKDKDGNPALSVCTKDSIANALLDMVLQGMSVSKKQGYFLVYGNILSFQRSYFGTISLAKRVGGISIEPVANIIYEEDDFVYTIDPNTGRTKIIKHEQKLENIDNNKIKGAYALLTHKDGSISVTLMSMQQIRSAWNQGPTKGGSPAHKNFTDEMSKKTVINRACKVIINSSDDSWLYDGTKDEMDIDTSAQQRDAIIHSDSDIIDTSVVECEVVDVETSDNPPY